MTKYAYLYLLDTLSDWEPGYLISELHSGRCFADYGTNVPVRTVGNAMEPITTMGGVRMIPDTTADQLDPADAAVLILPGGTTWLEPGHEAIVDAARTFLAAGVPVAAICGATMALAEAGMLDERPHTSNDLGALEAMCPRYRGRAHYRDEPAVTGDNVITASGLAPVEFAREVLAILGVVAPTALDAWHRLMVTRDPQAYRDLEAAI